MCLIIAKPKNVKFNLDLMENYAIDAHRANSHGMGFAIKYHDMKGKIFVNKGFFTVPDLMKALKVMQLPTEKDEVVVHFRLATSGNRDDKNCHPFICSKTEVYKTIGYTQSPVMAHNGVFSDFSWSNCNYSDSFYVAKHFMTDPEVVKLLNENNKSVMETVVSYNKLAILLPEADMFTCGMFQEHMGYMHSNSCAIPYTRRENVAIGFLAARHSSAPIFRETRSRIGKTLIRNLNN